MYGHLKSQRSKISNKKTWARLRKGSLNREIESLLIAAQNNAIRSDYIKAKAQQIVNVVYMVIKTKQSIE